MTKVTAQDFIKVFNGNADFNWVNVTWEGKYHRGEDVTRNKFDALLSQVRAQAASEKEDEMRRYMEEKIKEAKEIVRAQAHAEGRQEGLKEMDETWDSWYSGYYVRDLLVERHTNFPEDDGNLLKLRQEYQQPRSHEKETQ